MPKTLTSACVAMIVLAASPLAAQTPAAYEKTPLGRVLTCYAEAYTVVELVDVATRNLYMVSAEVTKEPTPERQNTVAGMLASGTLNDQQQTLDVVERLEGCVKDASGRVMPDASVSFTAGALREELAVAIMMAEGFASDFRQASPAVNRFLDAGGDTALQNATNGAYSRFGSAVAETLIRVRLAVDDLVAKTTPK